jgi:hypothetical protein
MVELALYYFFMAGYNNVVGTATLLYPRCIPTTAFALINQTNKGENIIIFKMPTKTK